MRYGYVCEICGKVFESVVLKIAHQIMCEKKKKKGDGNARKN